MYFLKEFRTSLRIQLPGKYEADLSGLQNSLGILLPPSAKHFDDPPFL